MAECVVAGIARTSDPAQLEKILMGCAHLEAQRLAVITKQQTALQDASPLQFVHTSAPQMRSTSDGTGVPGIGGGARTLSAFVGAGANVPHYLESVNLSRDLAENYNIAIHEGRSVVTFRTTTEEAPSVADTFRGCGLVNVRSLTSRSPDVQRAR